MSPLHETTEQDHAVVAKYLLEAHGKERQLETALKGQLAIAQSPLAQHALRDHLGVTRRQISALERRIDELGGVDELPGLSTAESVVELASTVANKGIALAKLPLQALRGTSAADKELRSLRDCYWNEAEEIAHYRVIETLARQVNDTETAELAARHRKEEEQMQHTLEGLFPAVVREVVDTESGGDEQATAAPAKPSRQPAAAATSSATARSPRASNPVTPPKTATPRATPKPKARAKQATAKAKPKRAGAGAGSHLGGA